MLKTLVFISLSILIFSQPYPLYKQCDNEWGYQQMGISFYDLCDAGSVVCCLAMSSPNNYNPGTLNKWLKQNNKYVSGSTISMTSLDGIGLSYQGKIANYQIKHNIDVGNVVIGQVSWGSMLAWKYDGDQIFVMNPTTRNEQQSYKIDEFIDGQTIIYKIVKKQNKFEDQ